jgi:tetratricopeptide (TPR) repeat protein
LLSRAGDHGAAAEAYARAIDLDPGLVLRHGPGLVAELRRAGRVEEAVDWTDRVASAPTATCADLYGLALVALDAGDDVVALGLLERVLAAQPEHADAHFQRGLIRLRAGATVEAVEDLRRCLDLAPGGPHAAEARALVVALAP